MPITLDAREADMAAKGRLRAIIRLPKPGRREMDVDEIHHVANKAGEITCAVHVIAKRTIEPRLLEDGEVRDLGFERKQDVLDYVRRRYPSLGQAQPISLIFVKVVGRPEK